MYEIIQPPISLIDIFHDIIHQKNVTKETFRNTKKSQTISF